MVGVVSSKFFWRGCSGDDDYDEDEGKHECELDDDEAAVEVGEEYDFY